MRAGELRADVVHIVGHAAEDGVDDRFLRVAACTLVAMQFLNPFEVDDRNDADEKVDVARGIDGLRDDGAMQPLVKEQIRSQGDVFPRCEGSRLLPAEPTLFRIMKVLACLRDPGLAVDAQESLDLCEEIRFGTEMAEGGVSGCVLRLILAHLGAVVAMEGVALDAAVTPSRRKIC